MEDGRAANSAEECKLRKYAALAEAHQFEPIADETMGVYGESTGAILRAMWIKSLKKMKETIQRNLCRVERFYFSIRKNEMFPQSQEHIFLPQTCISIPVKNFFDITI